MLKLIAPFMPHITEEIYHLQFAKEEQQESIHLSAWPSYDHIPVDEVAEKAGDLAVEAVSYARKFKSEMNTSLKTELGQMTILCTQEMETLLKTVEEDIKAAANAKSIIYGREKELKIIAEM